jgi:hypothetical protein
MISHTSTLHDDGLQAEEIVSKYYHALYSGDLESVKGLMTKESYYMALEPFGLKLSFKDPVFKSEWDKIEENKDALYEVEKKISAELLSRHLSPQIDITEIEPNGTERKIILYFSKENGHWLIDYYAGRPVASDPQSYFSSVKKWVISIFPSFK